MRIGILGAGIAGLEFGRLMNARGKDIVIFEKEGTIGGLAKTNKSGDYLWDFGVHAMYSKSSEITEYYHSLPLNYQHSERGVNIYHTGRNNKTYLVDYPFEEGVKDLPLGDRWDCVKGYIASRTKGRTDFKNLEDWIINGLGYGIGKHFMIPYNKKIWDCPLDQISMNLVSKKIEPTSIKNFLLAAMGKKIIGRVYQWKFIYPEKGVQELMDYTAREIKDRIHLNTAVSRLTRNGEGWLIETDNGKSEKVDKVVSTIPLPILLKWVSIDGVQKEYDVLKWNNTHFVMVGLKKGKDFETMRHCHWAFFKENEIFYRITLMHNFSKSFLPTLIAEITHKDDVMNMSKEQILEKTVEDLLRTRILQDRDDIAVLDSKLIHYTYPIPTVGLEGLKEDLTRKMEANNIYLLGRNGHWDYVNMDGVLERSRELASAKFSN